MFRHLTIFRILFFRHFGGTKTFFFHANEIQESVSPTFKEKKQILH